MSQTFIIKKVREYLNFLKKKKIDISRSSFAHLTSWVKTPGYVKLKILQKKNASFRIFFLLFKFFISSIFYSKKILIYPQKKISSKKIILSWCIKKDFSANGKYHDRYFGISNKESKDFFWILISFDNFIPRKIPNNILIIKLENNNIAFNFLIFLKNFSKLAIKNNFSILKILHYIFYTTNNAELLSGKIRSLIEYKKVKIVLLPYEAQPFQKIITSEIRKVNPTSKIIGYIHSSLPALPAEFIYDKLYSPDMLFYHGKSYKKILNKFLYWPKNRIRLTKSLKYKLNKSKNFKANIYLPYEINNKELLFQEFDNFIKSNNQYNFNKHEVIIHPVKKNVNEHIKFMNEIKKIKNKYNNTKNILGKKIPIFFGATTLFEGLEIYSEIIHISSDPTFEGLENSFWPHIEVKKLSNHVFKYKLLKLGEYIVFGNKSTNSNFFRSIIK